MLANETMKPAKLGHHLKTKDKEYVGKPIEFLERKCNKLKKHTKEETLHFVVPGGIEKATEASYKVPLLNAKAIKPHSIGQKLVKPTAKAMVNILFGRKSQRRN